MRRHFRASPPLGYSLPALIFGLCLLLLSPASLPAQEGTKAYNTEYASITFADEQDLHTFTRNIATGMSFLLERPERNPLLAKTRVDKIVDAVCAILDMRPLNLRFSIVLLKTQAEVTAAFRATGGSGTAPVAFYAHGNRSITLAIASINDRILAHEIAHAVICIYFGVPPPERMQEVLAQYVDKHLWNR